MLIDENTEHNGYMKYDSQNRINSKHHTAFVALIGRPNCGKSTLMNTIIGEELAVVTSLPQTTRKNLKGVFTSDDLQVIFVDTPGIHLSNCVFNKIMVDQALRIINKREIDVIGYIVDSSRQLGEEENVLAGKVVESGIPAIIVFNKIDLCLSIDRFVASFFKGFPALQSYKYLCVSAIKKETRDHFLKALLPLAPFGPQLFPADDLTDANLRFFTAEYIRKHIIRFTKDEVPHAVFVEILSYRETDTMHYIDAEVHVETDGQKAIIIGKKGTLIRRIQKDAAIDLERMTGMPATIICHVKITPKWRDNKRFLRETGFSMK